MQPPPVACSASRWPGGGRRRPGSTVGRVGQVQRSLPWSDLLSLHPGWPHPQSQDSPVTNTHAVWRVYERVDFSVRVHVCTFLNHQLYTCIHKNAAGEGNIDVHEHDKGQRYTSEQSD